jgi:small subunit ribosomal protein S20
VVGCLHVCAYAEWETAIPGSRAGQAHQSRAHFNQTRQRRVANIKSQIKRNKQNEAARLRNKAVKSGLKTAVRRVRQATDAGDAAGATEAMRAASRKLDKAASKGVIHKNQAANRKSALAKRVSSLSKG